MNLLIKDFPVTISKKNVTYNTFINILSKKSMLNDINSANIKFYGIDFFNKQEEQKLMELDSLKGLYNIL